MLINLDFWPDQSSIENFGILHLALYNVVARNGFQEKSVNRFLPFMKDAERAMARVTGDSLKIIHIITTLSTGGAEQTLYRLLAGGLEKYFHNLVISLSDEGVFGPLIRDLGIPVHTLRMRKGLPSVRSVYELRKVATKFQPDVIQGWMYHGNLAAWLARHLAPGRPALAWNIRNGLYRLENEKPITRLVIRANRFLSGAPESILYNSSLSRKQHEAFGFNISRGRLIPNGFYFRQLAPMEHKARKVRAELGIPDNPAL